MPLRLLALSLPLPQDPIKGEVVADKTGTAFHLLFKRLSPAIAIVVLFFDNFLNCHHGMSQTADVIFYNGTVLTMEDSPSQVSALAVQRDKILAVGTDAEILRLAGPDTQRLDLQGRLLMPGFIDCHGHFLSLGEGKLQLDLSTATRWQEIVEKVREVAKQRPLGTWIVGRGWHQEKWHELPPNHVEGYPVHHLLSQAVPDHPVLLIHATGHMVLANARAMQLAGVSSQSVDPPGGVILRTADGSPSGVFRENAMRPIYRAYERYLAERSTSERQSDVRRAIELAQQECLAHGVTSFHDAGSSLEEVMWLRQAVDEGRLRMRLYVMLNESNERLAPNLSRVRCVGYGGGRLTVRAIKRMIDGALGTHGAWLLEPYEDQPNNFGNNVTSVETIRRSAELALEHDFQLCVHAIGDRANREVLNLYEAIFAQHGNGHQLRWRIEHAQHLHPDDIPRFGRLGVIASMQAVHAVSDGPFVVERLGWRRAAQGAYVWQSLLRHGAVVVNGTDVPVESIDPLVNFTAAVTRRMANGDVFFGQQAMTRMQALRSYTRDAAFAAFEEHVKGTLRPGKLADVIVVSHNLLTVPEEQLSMARVDVTMVGGKIEFFRHKQPDDSPGRADAPQSR